MRKFSFRKALKIYHELLFMIIHSESSKFLSATDRVPKKDRSYVIQAGLYFAVAGSHPDKLLLVKKLIELGADVNRVTTEGNTPLMYAAKAQSPVIVAELLKCGARIDFRDKRGKDVVYYAFNPHDSTTLQVIKEVDSSHVTAELLRLQLDGCLDKGRL